MSFPSLTSSEWERYQLPAALIAGYGYGPDAGLVRTRMADGSTIQRRRHTLRPTLVDLRFPATAQELQTMEAVIDVYGFDWMDLPLRTSQGQTDAVSLHRAKFVSGYTVSARQSGTFELAITAQIETLDESCGLAAQGSAASLGCVREIGWFAYTLDWDVIAAGWGDDVYWGRPT